MPQIKDILVEYAQEIKNVYGINLRKILVFGSYARGDYRENSDIDIMILVTLQDKEIKKTTDKVADIAFDFLMKYGIDISPIVKNEEHFDYWIDTLPFYRNVQKEGIELIAG